MSDDRQTNEVIHTLERLLNDIRDQDLLSESLLARINASVDALKFRIKNLQAIEGAVEAIRSEILTPVQREISRGTILSRRGYVIGAIGIALSMSALFVSIAEKVRTQRIPAANRSPSEFAVYQTELDVGLNILQNMSAEGLILLLQVGDFVWTCLPDSLDETANEIRSYHLFKDIAHIDSVHRVAGCDSNSIYLEPTQLGYDVRAILRACIYRSLSSWLAHTQIGNLYPACFDLLIFLSLEGTTISPDYYNLDSWYAATDLERRGYVEIGCKDVTTRRGKEPWKDKTRCDIRLTDKGNDFRNVLSRNLGSIDFDVFRNTDLRELSPASIVED